MSRSNRVLVSLLLVAALLAPAGSAGAATIGLFSDVSDASPDAAYISYLVNKKMISGFPDGTFQPAAPLTRAAAVKIATQVAGLAPRSSGMALDFADLGDSHWASAYVRAAVENGLVRGYDDKTFRPGENMTRAQLAALALRATRQSATRLPDLQLKDVKSSDWFYASAVLAVAAGLMEAPDGLFRPGDLATRAEAARAFASAMVYTPSAFDVPLAVIVEVEQGFVEVAGPDSDAYAVITGPTPLQAGGRVRTGAASAAAMTFPDGSGFYLDSLSEMLLIRSKGTEMITGMAVEDLEVELVQGHIFGALVPRLSESELAGMAPDLTVYRGESAAPSRSGSALPNRVHAAAGTAASALPEGATRLLLFSNPASLVPGEKEPTDLTIVLANEAGEPITAQSGDVVLQVSSDVGGLNQSSVIIPLGFQAVTVDLTAPPDEPEDQKTRVTATVGDLASALTIPTAKGSWWSGLFSQKTRAKVRMPFSVASVRGSMIQAEVSATENTVSVLGGDVLLTSANGQQESLTDNQFAQVNSPELPPSTPEPMSLDHQQQWQALKPWVEKQAERMAERAPRQLKRAVENENARIKNLVNLLPADEVAPTLSISSPLAGTVGDKNIRVDGVASDDIKLTSVTVNGKKARVDKTGVWSAEISLESGSSTITAVAADGAGNTASAEVAVTYDATYPSVRINAPKAVKARSTDINGVVKASLGIQSLTANGQPLQYADDGSFTISAELAAGANLVVVEVTDTQGRTATAEATVGSSAVPPEIQISAATESVSAPQYIMQGKVVARDLPVASVKVNRKSVLLADDGSFTAVLKLRTGENTITVEAEDTAGNRSTASKTVNLGASLQLDLSQPKDGLATKSATVQVRGSVRSVGSQVSVSVNGQHIDVDGSGRFAADVNLEPGANKVSVIAADGDGRSATEVRTVTRTGVAPVLTINGPEEGFNASEPQVLVSAQAQAASGEIKAVRVNGRMVVLNDGAFSLPVALTSGANTITIQVSDTAGNRTEATRTVYYSQHGATISLSSPSEGLKTSASEIAVSGTVESGGAVSTVTLNGKSVAVSKNGRFSATLPLVSGSNTITVSLPADSGGASLTRTVYQMAEPPSLRVSSPASGAVSTTEYVTVSGVAVTAQGSAAAVAVNGQVATVDARGRFSVTVQLKQGANTLSVVARDQAGSTASASIAVSYEPVNAQTSSTKGNSKKDTTSSGSSTSESGTTTTTDPGTTTTDPGTTTTDPGTTTTDPGTTTTQPGNGKGQGGAHGGGKK